MNLPNHLKEYLAHLRADERFQQIVRAIPRSKLRPFPANGDREKAANDLIYLSGKLAGEKAIMIGLLGHDPDDRQSE